jgi:hypothetical protein
MLVTMATDLFGLSRIDDISTWLGSGLRRLIHRFGCRGLELVYSAVDICVSVLEVLVCFCRVLLSLCRR